MSAKRAHFEFLPPVENHNIALPMVLRDDMPPAEKKLISEMNNWAMHANKIREALKNTPHMNPASYSSIQNSSPGPHPGPEERHIQDQYDCPLEIWDEITNFLFNNRGALELGLDTMGFVSEPTLWRYIRDRATETGERLVTTPRDFRQFLGVANEKEVLFKWKPFPGAGLVRRIKEGWPTRTTPDVIPSPPKPIDEGEEIRERQLGRLLVEIISGEPFQSYFYERKIGESKDVDTMSLFIHLLQLWKVVGEKIPVKFESVNHLENIAARCILDGSAKDVFT